MLKSLRAIDAEWRFDLLLALLLAVCGTLSWEILIIQVEFRNDYGCPWGVRNSPPYWWPALVVIVVAAGIVGSVRLWRSRSLTRALLAAAVTAAIVALVILPFALISGTGLQCSI